MTNINDKILEKFVDRHTISLQQLTIGTFETENAAVDVLRDSLIISFNDEAGTKTLLNLDLESISTIRQSDEAGSNVISFTLRPLKVQEFAKKIPGGFTFSCSGNNRNHIFAIKFSNEIDEMVVADLMNILSPIAPSNLNLSSGEKDLKRSGSDENLFTDENSPPNCKKPRNVESTSRDNESSLRPCRQFVKSVFDEDSNSDIQDEPSDTASNNVFPVTGGKRERILREPKLTRKLPYVSEPNTIYGELESDSNEAWEESIANVKIRRSASSKFDGFNDAETLMIYPPGSDNHILMENYKCLDQSELIDDVILDFYIQYIFRELMNDEMRERVHICSSSFYSLYSTQANFAGWKDGGNKQLSAGMKRYLRVKDLPCIKNANIFEKDFIVFPCHDNGHWFLVIACYPRMNGAVTVKDGTQVEGEALIIDRKNPEAGEPVKRSCILAFDSVRSNPGRRSKAMIHIRNFLGAEYNEKYQKEFPFLQEAVVAHSIKCPQQSNATDCGLYLLEFVERFFVTSPLNDLRFIIDLSDWFSADVILQKRERIAQIIQSFIVQQKGELPDLPPIRFGFQESDHSINKESNSNGNNGDNNNEEEFNNNNDFNAVDHNKASSSVEPNVVFVDSQLTDPLGQMSQSKETSPDLKYSLTELCVKIQDARQPTASINEPEASPNFFDTNAEHSQLSIPATQDDSELGIHSEAEQKTCNASEVIELDSD